MMLDLKLSGQLEKNLGRLDSSVKRLVLALSGGLDSCVLLHLLHSRGTQFELLLWHMNHALLDCAGEMESFCVQLAGQYGIRIKVSHLHLAQCRSNIEATARTARYAEFAKTLGPEDALLSAHHADDQAETYLLNLFRSSGSAGLRGIAHIRPFGASQLLRPLLDVGRAELHQYALQHQLRWFDDPSNAAVRFNRNYLRHRILPGIKARWPGYLGSIRSACRIHAETQVLLEEIGANDYHLCRPDRPAQVDNLCQERLLKLSEPRQKNVIRYWLKQHQCDNLPESRLTELIKQLRAGVDTQPQIQMTNYDIRVYQRQIYRVPHQDYPSLRARYDLTDAETLSIPALGLCIHRGDFFRQCNLVDRGQLISIRFRTDESRHNPDKHRLKRLFQKHQVPMWLRGQTPQIFIDGELKGIWFKINRQK